MKKGLITSSIIALVALASCSQVVSPNTKDNDITGLETTYQVTCGNKFEEESKAVVSTSKDLKFAFYTDEQLTKRYYDIKFDGLVGSINGGTSADYWVKVTAGGGATGYKEVSKVAKITATCVQSEIAIVPTDCIGEKAFVCKYCGAKMSSGGLPMQDDDIKLIARTEDIGGGKLRAYLNYGASEGLIQPVSEGEPFLENDVTWQFDDKTVTTPRKIDLPKINFAIHKDRDILLRFRTNNAPIWGPDFIVHLGTNEEGNNLFDGAYEARWAGSAGPDMTGYFLLNYNSTNKELTIRNTLESDKIVTITDSDIINGNKSISLYGYCGTTGWRTFALFEKCIGLNHIHTWSAEKAPTDKIGFKVHECTVCKEHEYTDNLMTDSDIKIDSASSYSADANMFYTSAQSATTEGVWGMTWRHDTAGEYEMSFPKVMFKEYSGITFNFTTNEATWGGGQVALGTVSQQYNLISDQLHRQALSGKITAAYNKSTQELTLTAWDVTEQNGETQLGTATISIEDDIASGSKNLKLYLKLGPSRGFGITSVTVTTK